MKQSTTCKTLMYVDQYGKLYTENELNGLPATAFQARDFHVLEI
ncbi:MAG: hypothetical protein ABH828_06185 [archaeon]